MEDVVRTPRGGARAPEPREIGGGGSRPAGLPVRVWRRVAELGREVVAAAGGLLAALGMVLVGVVFVESLIDRTIDVQPLSVPKSLADDGLSPEVVALTLRDQMNLLADRVRQERGFSDDAEIIDPEELPDVAVPSVGLSAQALAAEVRSFFKIQNRMVISGEVVSRDGAYDLVLRLNGRAIFHSPDRLPRDRLDALFAGAARAAVAETQPYAGAVLAADDGDYAGAIAISKGIIARGRTTRAARYASLLQAQALIRLRQPEAAEAVYRELVGLDPRDVAAHDDLGGVLLALGRRDEAVAEYRTAIAIDGTLAFAHEHLALAYLAMGRPGDAIEEARVDVGLSPKSLVPRLVLARALRAAGRTAEAREEYRAAAARETRRASLRVEIGEALRGFGLRDEALAQFRQAVALDPGSPDARRDLASLLDEPGPDAGAPRAEGAAPAAASPGATAPRNPD